MRYLVGYIQNMSPGNRQIYSTDRNNLKKFLINMIKVCGSGFLIFVLIKSMKWKLIAEVLSNANWYFIFALIPLSMCGQVLCSLKWWYIARAYLPGTKLRVYVELYFVGSFINRFLPSTIGGDIGRAGLLLWKENISLSQSGVTVFIERLTGLAVLFFIACIGTIIYFSKTLNSTVVLLGVFGFIGIVFILIFFFTSAFNNVCKLTFLNRFRGIFSLLETYRENYKILFVSLLISLFFYFIEISVHGALFSQFNFSVHFIDLLTVIPVVYLVQNIPIAISGIGLRENAYIFFFGFVAIPPEISVSVAFIIFFYTIVQGLVGGVLLVKMIIFQKNGDICALYSR